jgi:adenosylhomocysteine nucleosidase
MPELTELRIVLVISAGTEWRVIRDLFPDAEPHPSRFGEWLVVDVDVAARSESILFFHGGWGKIAAAASTQYAIDCWAPELLINLGTCGGFEGEIEKGTIILAERTLVYDIVEQMGDYQAALAHYATDVDLSWLKEDHPQDVRRTLLVSGDRDLLVEDIPRLKAEFGAVAGDWESGAIAWVAARNDTRCLILRGVSDLVGPGGGEAYAGNMHVFVASTTEIMQRLVHDLPAWIASAV